MPSFLCRHDTHNLGSFSVGFAGAYCALCTMHSNELNATHRAIIMICDHNFYVISFIYRNINTQSQGYHPIQYRIPDTYNPCSNPFPFPFLFFSFNFDNSVSYFSLLFSNQNVYGLKCILSSLTQNEIIVCNVQCVDRSESPYMHCTYFVLNYIIICSVNEMRERWSANENG